MKTLTIVTVVYNDLNAFKVTHKSICNQSFLDIEWVVVDGGSTDGTLDYIKAHQLDITTWISEPDNGIFDAMNKGISLASGQWINFMNAGDTYRNESTLHSIFSQDNLKHYDFIYSDMFLIDKHNQPVRPIKAEKLTKYTITKGMIACHQGMFVRLKHCPLYNPDYIYQGDLHWTMDILNAISLDRILYFPYETVVYKSDGFSNQQLFKQLSAHLSLIITRYGYFRLIYTSPRLCRRYLGKWLRRLLNIETFRFWIKTE
tara:strand:- start:124 stop:900 length:777 start_codon:yes stop_codon:yes gene_type:complete